MSIVAERRARLQRQRPAQPLRALGVLEDEHLLQEDRRAQAGAEDEMPLQQRAGGAKLLERLSGDSSCGSVMAPFLSSEARRRQSLARRRANDANSARCVPEEPVRRFETKSLGPTPDAVAPDGTAVRLLLSLSGGSFAHFELAAGAVSHAVAHRTVEEIWYFVSGSGEVWRRQARSRASSRSSRALA